MSPQNRLFCIAGGLLLALPLSGCTTPEYHGPKEVHGVVICLIVSPGSQDSYKYSSNSPDVVLDKPPPPDKIGLNTTTGEVDLTELVVTPGYASDPRRPVQITYTFDCAGNGQYSFYFTNINFPIVPKSNDTQKETERVDPFKDGDTNVIVHYRNHPKDMNFPYFIDYTWKKIATGEVENRRTPDPNIKNTP